MTREEIRRRVEIVRGQRDDDERAHGSEDMLWIDVLIAIADGAPDAAELAIEALKTREIEFSRWCA